MEIYNDNLFKIFFKWTDNKGNPSEKYCVMSKTSISLLGPWTKIPVLSSSIYVSDRKRLVQGNMQSEGANLVVARDTKAPPIKTLEGFELIIWGCDYIEPINSANALSDYIGDICKVSPVSIS